MTRYFNKCLFFALAVLHVFPIAVLAEDFRFEFTASYWPLTPAGDVQTTTTRVFLGPDLGIRGRKSHGAFKLALKPSPKHRFNLEVIPYRLRGANTVNRPFELGGRTIVVQEQIQSKVNADFVLGEYQYDIVNNANGHVGISGGLAYFGATASVNVPQRPGPPVGEQGKAPLPLIGGEFRIFPIGTMELLNINGGVRGMPFGPYGHYIHMNLNLGVAVAKAVRLQVGYTRVDLDAHVKNRTRGFDMRFEGPVLSLQFHD